MQRWAPERATIDWSDLVTNSCDFRVDIDELVRDVPPIESVDDLAAPGVFNTDGELDEFLASVRADRDANLDRTWHTDRPRYRRRVLDHQAVVAGIAGAKLIGRQEVVTFVAIGELIKWPVVRNLGTSGRTALVRPG